MINISLYTYAFVLILVIFFVREQFEHKRLNRVNFFVIPVFSLYQFLTNIEIKNLNDIILLTSIFLVATFVGYLQTISFEIDQQYIDTHYFITTEENKKIPITREVYFVKGGLSYLIGWVAIFMTQILVSLYFHEIQINDVEHELVNELINDIVVFLRIDDHKSWWIWELFAVSNYSYYRFLLIKNNQFRKAIISGKASNPI